MRSTLALCFLLASAAPLISATSLAATDSGLFGEWIDDEISDMGTKETLTLFPNGAYKSETAIVESAALETYVLKRCRERDRTRGKKARCDAKSLAEDASMWAKHFPEIFIGTYTTESGRIAFTHGCAEGTPRCSPGLSTESLIYFIEGDRLTIKGEGYKYKGKMVGAGMGTYTRHRQ